MTYCLYFSHFLLSSLSSSFNGLNSHQLATGIKINFGTQYTFGGHLMLPSPSLVPSFLQSAPNPSDQDQSTLYFISFLPSAETTVISGIEWVCFNTVSLGHGNEKHGKLKCSHQHFSSSRAGRTWLSGSALTQVSVFSPVCLSPDTYSMPSSFFYHLSPCLIVNWCKYLFRELFWQHDLSRVIPVDPHGLGGRHLLEDSHMGYMLQGEAFEKKFCCFIPLLFVHW